MCVSYLFPHEWLEKSKSCLDTMNVKMDLVNETTTILMEEKERMKGRVNFLGGELRKWKKCINLWMNV